MSDRPDSMGEHATGKGDDAPLRQLARRAGILDEYLDQTGRELRRTSDDTRAAILTAMGFDVSSPSAATLSLEAWEVEDRRSLLAPVRVVVAGTEDSRVLVVQAPAGRANSGPWRLEISREDGGRHVSEGPWRGDGALELRLPELPIGYHRLRLDMSTGGSEWSNEQMLIVVPPRCLVPEDLLGGRPAFGLVANLYTVRSRGNWGVGDLSDLAAIAEWGADASIGAEFVGVNPLHALLNRGGDISPYSPTSRLFRNPIYIDVTRVPELAHAPAVQARIASPEFAAELEALRDAPRVQYEQVMAVKGLVLGALHRVFVERVRGSGDARDRDYEQFVRETEPALGRFAVWMAIAERQPTTNWHEWPAELRDSRSAAVAAFAREHAAAVDLYRWLQFETDRQLCEAGVRARNAGMRIGLYQDLAIGCSGSGADAWAFPELFVHGVSIGAPPDPYAAMGQNWGLPPIDPRVLKRTCYAYFIDLVRSGFHHAGALRIDHVLGLFRLFWIPEGMSGEHGAYVRYPSEDLLGIIALESVRNRALVVGEDLGTVPPEVPPALERWGLLSSKVLQFEREGHGFKPPRCYPSLALATADTHDMAPITGWWDGRDIALREEVGLIDAGEAARARDDRAHERQALLDRLAAEHVLPEARSPHSGAELRAAVHGLMCRTPSQLVGLALDDLAGEIEPVNVPGVGPDRFPSWTRKMRDDIETIMSSDDTERALRCDGRRRSELRDTMHER